MSDIGPRAGRNAKPVFRVGDFQRIYDPSLGETRPWYINDHTFIQAEDGHWRLFGITHPEPAAPLDEKFFAHASAPDILGPWMRQTPVLPVNEDYGETHVWAPYVLRHQDTYWMYYCAGGAQHEAYRIHLATSRDLETWRRHPANPMIVDGFDARDPMVVRLRDRWALYYTATSTPKGGAHVVKAAFSDDLVHWSGAREVFRHSKTGAYGGPTESPFVVTRRGVHYLFVTANEPYNSTIVYRSDNPLTWRQSDVAGTFPAHAAEVVRTHDGRWYVSRAGWGQGGVYLAELIWLD
ncbi:MAG: hypothetical protein ACHP84_06220 [Caulobacterales bacterium]